jgi:hypothetical protein
MSENLFTWFSYRTKLIYEFKFCILYVIQNFRSKDYRKFWTHDLPSANQNANQAHNTLGFYFGIIFIKFSSKFNRVCQCLLLNSLLFSHQSAIYIRPQSFRRIKGCFVKSAHYHISHLLEILLLTCGICYLSSCGNVFCYQISTNWIENRQNLHFNGY